MSDPKVDEVALDAPVNEIAPAESASAVEADSSEVKAENGVKTEAVDSTSEGKTANVGKFEDNTSKPEVSAHRSDARNHKHKGKYDNKRRYENGNKFDPSVMPITDDAGRIRAQVGLQSSYFQLVLQ
jgi:hypothetical protein